MIIMENIFKTSYPGIKTILDKLLEPIFGHYKLSVQDILTDYLEKQNLAQSANITQIQRVAEFEIGVKSLYIYDITLSKNARLKYSRVNIQRVVRSLMDVYTAALMFFHYEDNQGDWRISFVEKENTIEKTTSAKRYTYLVGENQAVKTVTDRFKKLAEASSKTVEAVREAFSVEALTKEFYNELFSWYEWAIDPKTGITFPNNTKIAEDDREKIDEKIIRLITRLLFVWFIKQKELVPDYFFDVEKLKDILKDFKPESKENGNYYNAILQNLFFATLNKEIKDRKFAKENDNKREIKTLYRYQEMFQEKDEKKILKLFETVPFLNGGLFECLDKTIGMDGVQYAFDGFSRNSETFKDGTYKHRAFIPNKLFFDDEKGIIPLLKRYNFTIEENSPEEIQVALDPELLGKVFENLLGAYNPETKETAKKQSGSFYTPREIVDYMVNESLIAFLAEKTTKLNLETIKDLFYKDELPEKLAKNSKLCEEISKILQEVKILDPACGSGAFPMGILNKMVHILEKLDRQNKPSTYDQKLHLIENCIYGVDIQNIAVQISKLRFFISLICESNKDETKLNFGIPTLPNLETKFVAANTLIGIDNNENTNLFADPDGKIKKIKDEILEIRHKHFSAQSAYEKNELRKKDEILREKLANKLKENYYFATEDIKQLLEWNPYDQNAVANFFDPDWMFNISNGFDIVIGNPPYRPLQKDNRKLSNLYKDLHFDTFDSKGDIYCLFYDKGYHLLRPDGLLMFITSNKWMRAEYGEKLRKFLTEKTNPILLIDFAGIKVFKSVEIDNNILLFQKSKNKNKTLACITKDKKSLNNLSNYIQQNSINCKFNKANPWVILSEIEQRIKAKIEAVGTPLKDWDIQINYGIKTGFNEAFIIKGKKREEILSNCKTEEERKRTDELIRPILRGRDIKRYGYEFADLYLLFIPWHFPLHNDTSIIGASEKAEKEFNKQYPAVYNHLLNYKEQLSNRNKAETGIRYEWYALQRWGANYWEDFSKQKIAWNRIASEKQFALIDEGMFIQDSMHFFTGNHLHYLVAILNSKLFAWLLNLIVGEAAGGNAGNSDNIRNLKIPYPSVELEQEIVKHLKNKNYNEINNIIFNLYKLNHTELLIIEGS